MRKTNKSEPINRFLVKNRKKHPVSFHMPGHKYGRFSYCLGRRYSSFDITEIPGADNIKKPEGIIKKSIRGISDAYGSKTAFYLTNGTTSGIHAIMRYAALNGGKILLSRDCHISAVNGAILFGVEVSFIPIVYKDGMPLPVRANSIAKAVEENPKACGVLITSPNYYGKAADIHKIAEIIHSKNMFLAVDEAHGAHFGFSGLGELSGIKCGADIVCHSLHKSLPVYNQGAVLHICSDMIDIMDMKNAVNMLGTTSPSYPLMASMEKAVRVFRSRGIKMYKKLREKIVKLKAVIESETTFKIIGTDDFTRIIIETGIGGFETARLLHEKYRIDVEAADFSRIICIATPMNRKIDFNKLARALKASKQTRIKIPEPDIPGVPECKMSINKAYKRKAIMVPVDMAEGCICGTILVSYPPGTPLVCPGEIIDGYAVNYIKKIINAGGTILGIEDKKIPVLEQT